MSKMNAGLLDGLSGKLGNVVMRMRKGEQVASVYQPVVYNPNTEGQQEWRFRFSKISDMGQKCANFINLGFAQYTKKMSARNYFMKKNVTDVFTGTWPNLVMSYSKLVFSAGPVDLPFNPAATASETAVTFTWTDNSGIGNAQAADKASFLIFNKSQGTSQVLTDAAARTAATYSFTFATAWAGDEVELYMFMRGSGVYAGECSPSVYLGNITL